MADAPPPDPPASQPNPAVARPTEARALGRRLAFVVFILVAAAVGISGGAQVFVQAFSHRAAPQLNIQSCDEGLGRLSAAVSRAREAASGTEGEDSALERYRQALRPDWDDRDHIEDLCRSNPQKMAVLDAIEQLRYAEEHAARREAAELAPLRRRVQAIAPTWPTTTSTSPAPNASASAAPTE
ncbi:MAG: hypothetical protein IPK82_28725 [Polyangiaceae bacterium]|nr:hypothetical protein [Polyangiaceae bacterium]